MYTEHFGLDREPFRARREGRDIYVGPRHATVISRLKRALAMPDAVVAVTGPVGVGKTAVVSRALDALEPRRRVARIGRMRLGPDEVLELLLAELGVSRQPRGTIQRFATFKRLLDEFAGDGVRAVIVVEDARRVGIDALLELEAMTAGDGSETGSANLVLMGDSQLPAFLGDPALARLVQRTRARQVIEPFDAGELGDYLRHCVRLAGGELDDVFAPGSTEMLHRCSEGIPRVVNNICETALAEAADANAKRVSVDLLRDIARDVYGIEALPSERVTPGSAAAAREEEFEEPQQDEEFFSAGEFEAEPAAGERAADGDLQLDDVSPTCINEARPERADELREPEEAANDAAEVEAPQSVTMPGDEGDSTLARAGAGWREADDDAEVPVSDFSPSPVITIVDRQRDRTLTTSNIRALRMNAWRDREDAAADGAASTPDAASEPPSGTADDETAAADRDTPLVLETEPDAEAEDQEAADTDADEPVSAAETADAEDQRDSVAADTASADSRIPEDIESVLALDDEAGDVTDEEPAEESAPDEPPGQARLQEIDASRNESDIDTMTPESEELVSALDELEQALSSANETPTAGADDVSEDAEAATHTAIPDITLERSMAPPEPTNEVSRWQEELARAGSLEEMSDMLAETVFGDKAFDQIAAQVTENPPDDAEAGATAEPRAAESAGETEPADEHAANDASASDPERAAQGRTGGFDLSISKRFELLRSLRNAGANPADGESVVAEITLGEDGPPPESAAGYSPETIESQIDTAITQSRPRLSAADIESMDGQTEETPPDDEKQSTGFFGLFKRSSKS